MQGPSLSAKGSYVRFKSAVWKLPDHKSQTDYRNIIFEINISLSSQNESADGCPDANPTALDGGDDLYTSVESRVFVSRLEALSCLKALTKKLGKDKGPVRLKAFEDH